MLGYNKYLSSRSKRLLDFSVALLLGLLVAPLALMLFVVLTLFGGHPLFAHERIGKGGVKFRCYKFRTMIKGAEQKLELLLEEDPIARASWAAHQKLDKDPRITTFGAFLRKSSLDEIPQLVNVLRGEMSIVGPRPITEGELYRYKRSQRYYLKNKPGITGIWQCSGRNDVSYSTRVAMDRKYHNEASVCFDVYIMWRTIHAVLARRGAG